MPQSAHQEQPTGRFPHEASGGSETLPFTTGEVASTKRGTKYSFVTCSEPINNRSCPTCDRCRFHAIGVFQVAKYNILACGEVVLRKVLENSTATRQPRLTVFVSECYLSYTNYTCVRDGRAPRVSAPMWFFLHRWDRRVRRARLF